MKKIQLLFLSILYFSSIITAQEWTYFSSIIPTNPNPIDNFGQSIAKSGNYLVVGAPNDHIENNETNGDGVVHIYLKGQNGVYEKIFQLYEQSNFGHMDFGYSVSIEGNFIAVGAPSYYIDEPIGYNTRDGAVFIYEIIDQNEINLVQKIKVDTVGIVKRFGNSVLLHNGDLIIGAPWDKYYFEELEDEMQTGSVFIYKRNKEGKFKKYNKLIPEIRKPDANFGHAIDADDNFLLISAPGKINSQITEHSLIEKGSVYLYSNSQNESWEFQQKFEGENPEEYSGFGQSISMDNGLTAIGAPFSNQRYNGYDYDGAVYILALENNNQWQLSDRIELANKIDYKSFGENLSLKNRTLAVQRSEIFDQNELISIYKFDEFNNWFQDPPLTPPDIPGEIYIDGPLLMDSLELFIGAYMSNLSQNPELFQSGGIYIYHKPQINIIPKSKVKTTIYPNPFTDHVNIYMSELTAFPTISLYNEQGQLILSEYIEEHEFIYTTLDVPENNGVYFLKITDDEGLNVVRKLVKM